MLKKLAALLALVSLARSECHNAQTIDGITHAICTDHETGFEFEYIDEEGRHPLVDIITPEKLSAIYADYWDKDRVPREPPSISNRSVKATKRELQGYWEACKEHVEGVCADDHVIKWRADGAYFMKKLKHQLIRMQKNGRSAQDPRAICTKWAAAGNMCLQWAFNLRGKLTASITKAMVENTWDVCQKNYYSSEVRFNIKEEGDSGDSGGGEGDGDGPWEKWSQYACISDRAEGCKVNPTMNLCDSDYIQQSPV